MFEDCTVVGFGRAAGGRLGIRQSIYISHPTPVDALGSDSWLDVACGDAFSLVRSVDLFRVAVLGHVITPPVFSRYGDPISFLSFEEELQSIVAGSNHVLFLTRSGAVYTYGAGAGTGFEEPAEFPTLFLEEGVYGTAIVEISAFGDFSACRTEDGRVFVWGDFGGDAAFLTPMEAVVSNIRLLEAKSIACGNNVIAIVTHDGVVHLVSYNNEKFTFDISVKLEFLQNLSVDSVYFVKNTSGYVLTRDKKVYRFDTRKKSCEMIKCEEEIESLSCNRFHIAAVTENGHLATMGDGSFGELGRKDDKEARNKLVIVDGCENVRNVSCGVHHTIFIGNVT